MATISWETLHKSIWRFFYYNTWISTWWGFWSVHSFVGGWLWHMAPSVLENILWAITWSHGHLPFLTFPNFLMFPLEIKHIRVFWLIQPDHKYVSSCRGCSLSLYLFIYLHFLMLILLLYTLGKLLFKLLSCLDKNKKAFGGNIHVLCVWARLVIFNHSC